MKQKMVSLWMSMGFQWDFYGISMGFLWDFCGISMGFLKSVEEKHVPSGNLLHKYGKIHHAMNGKTHYKYDHFQ